MTVLIYGPRKSGTTLFQRLLDGGDELFVHPSETKIKFFISLKKIHQEPFATIDENEIDYYFRAYKKQWESVDNDLYLNYIKNHYKSVKSLEDFIHLDITASKAALGKEIISPRNWAIKEISGNTSEILKTFLETFKKGKVLMIIRDPRRVASAVYREKKKTGTSISWKRAWYIAKESYRTIREQAKFVGHPRVKLIYFEDLILNTEKQMREVADFLGISFSEKFLKPTFNGVECIVPTSSKKIKKVFVKNDPLYKDINPWQYLSIIIQSRLNKSFIENYLKRGFSANGYPKLDRKRNKRTSKTRKV